MAPFPNKLPPLGTLGAFEAAARLGSFTAAAAERHVTQAAVSRQMRVLEADLGVRLFVRGRRSVSLTRDGADLLRAVRPSLERLGATAQDIRTRDGDHGLTVFSELGLATGWLVPRLSLFLLEHPGVLLRLVTSDEPIERYPRQFDLGLQTGRWPLEGLDVTSLDDDEVFAVCAPGYGASLTASSSPAALLGAPLLEMEWVRNWIRWPEYLALAGVEGKPEFSGVRFTSYPVLLEAARLGHGIALAWGHSVARDLEEGSLIRATTASVSLRDGVCAYLPREASAQGLLLLRWLSAGQ